jgi:dTDP-3-amino-3,4,6-trideoxy-alpha-D-glucose transaminase
MNAPIPFLDLAAGLAELRDEIDAAIDRTLSAGSYILGPEVESFEAEFASYCETRHCIGVGNGLDALQLVLRALEIGAGSEVLVPAYTAVATWMAVSAVGARPVGVDVDPLTWTMDPALAAAAVTPATRAIIPVHLFGRMADMQALETLGTAASLSVIEDAAQAHGARSGGRRAGSLGRAGCFSFYPTKNLGAFGDGGAIVTSDDSLACEVRRVRSYGWRDRGVSEVLGLNTRLDELQASILRVKLRRLDEWNDRRRALVRRYAEALSDVPGIRPPAHPRAGDEAVWHLYVAETDDRDVVARRAATRGVMTLVHYEPLPHLTPAYRALGWGDGDFPVAEGLARRALSLPMWPQLAADAPRQVAESLRP